MDALYLLQPFYSTTHIKSDLRKDNYKYYRQNLVGKLTTDPNKALSPDVLYSEIYDEFGGVIPHPDKIINDILNVSNVVKEMLWIVVI